MAAEATSTDSSSNWLQDALGKVFNSKDSTKMDSSRNDSQSFVGMLLGQPSSKAEESEHRSPNADENSTSSNMGNFWPWPNRSSDVADDKPMLAASPDPYDSINLNELSVKELRDLIKVTITINFSKWFTLVRYPPSTIEGRVVRRIVLRKERPCGARAAGS
jgi:hypothetical protein